MKQMKHKLEKLDSAMQKSAKRRRFDFAYEVVVAVNRIIFVISRFLVRCSLEEVFFPLHIYVYKIYFCSS